MTILPKKKNAQAKNDNENVDNAGNVLVSNHPISTATESRGVVVDRLYTGGGRTSPPNSRWPSMPSARDVVVDKRGAQSAVANPYGEYVEGLVDGSVVGGVSGSSGVAHPNNPTQHKRRHRASPHRNVRKHIRDHRSSANPNPSAVGMVSLSAPSTSGTPSLALAAGNSPPNAGSSSSKATSDSMAEDCSGYNSGDEYNSRSSHMWTEEEWMERERIFEKKLRKKGFVIKKMGEDGACLFRAVADQIYGDQEMHGVVRKHCMDYMAKNADYFSQYVTEDFDTYLNRKRLEHIHGNHVEMQALCEIYNRSIEVFHYTTDPINTFHGIHSTDNEPIRISYHKNIHYNSIVDPYKATVGVGLGLPGFIPGLAEKNLMCDAVRQSEDFHIEQAMLEDKLKATDWEATNEAIEEQVARESYLQWLRDNERRNRKATTRSATATCSSSGGGASPDVRSPIGNRSPRGRPSLSASNSPARVEPGSSLDGGSASTSLLACDGNKMMVLGNNTTSEEPVASAPTTEITQKDFRLLETASFINQLPPDVFGLSEWEDADILAQVLAASQQEYLDTLKRNATSSAFATSGSSSSSSSSGNEGMAIGLGVAVASGYPKDRGESSSSSSSSCWSSSPSSSLSFGCTDLNHSESTADSAVCKPKSDSTQTVKS